MLQPKKVKHRKVMKGRMRGKAYRGGTLAFGDYGLQAMKSGRISARQIEAARIAMTRYVKRGGKIWIRIFPDKPVTKKPAETRMGLSGKIRIHTLPPRLTWRVIAIRAASIWRAVMRPWSRVWRP